MTWKEYKRTWRTANRDKLSDYHLRYYHAHKDQIKAKETAAGTRARWQARQTSTRNLFKLIAAAAAIAQTK